jgi:hypothetical protein
MKLIVWAMGWFLRGEMRRRRLGSYAPSGLRRRG